MLFYRQRGSFQWPTTTFALINKLLEPGQSFTDERGFDIVRVSHGQIISSIVIKFLLAKTFIYGEFGNSETKMSYYVHSFTYSNVYWAKKKKSK